MQSESAAAGTVHQTPDDLLLALNSHPEVLDFWNNLTPVARDEWICWTISVKKPETRQKHIERLISDLKKGKRRPCCWAGCPHRNPAAEKWYRREF